MLVISGFFDMVTPVNQSAEIAWRVSGDAVHYCDPFSSHATLLESPEYTLAEIHHFLQRHKLLRGCKVE